VTTPRVCSFLRFPGALAALLMLVVAPAGTLIVPRSASAELPPEARRLEKALKGVRGIRADFVQIRDVALTGEEIQAKGMLAFRPPHEFRLAYGEPDPQELVIRGDSLWVILPEENQAQRYPFSADSPGSEIFLLFGGKNRSLEDAFRITQEEWGSEPAALRLVPREADPGYPIEDIRLIVGKDGFAKRLFFKESTGDTVVFEFTRVVKNPPGIQALVALHVPKGMEVIDATPTPNHGGPGLDREP
jgi:outer membrane lipoprotein carrier protein